MSQFHQKEECNSVVCINHIITISVNLSEFCTIYRVNKKHSGTSLRILVPFDIFVYFARVGATDPEGS